MSIFRRGYKQGDILKFSRDGIIWLAGPHQDKAERMKGMRFEYRCVHRVDKDCITVRTIPNGHYRTYHKAFMERAK